jgi:hypothetical protein
VVRQGAGCGYEVEADEPQTRLRSGAVGFNMPFSGQGANPPVVVATSQDPNYYATVSGASDAGFTLMALRRDGASVTATPVYSWIASG